MFSFLEIEIIKQIYDQINKILSFLIEYIIKKFFFVNVLESSSKNKVR